LNTNNLEPETEKVDAEAPYQPTTRLPLTVNKKCTGFVSPTRRFLYSTSWKLWRRLEVEKNNDCVKFAIVRMFRK